MATKKLSKIEKQVEAAQKRLATFIDKITEKAKADTAKDFAEARSRLKIK
jgi:hypothetical protein